MQHTFNPEFLNRLDDVIVFHPLSLENIADIVGILLKDVQKRLGDEELTLKLTEAASAFLVKNGYDEKFGARPLKRAIQKFIEDPLSRRFCSPSSPRATDRGGLGHGPARSSSSVSLSGTPKA
jgi:ATP-dependent Clp protease ATP-binding subunit ClpC